MVKREHGKTRQYDMGVGNDQERNQMDKAPWIQSQVIISQNT